MCIRDRVIALALAMAMAASMTAMAAPALDALDPKDPDTTCGDVAGSDGNLLPGNEYHYSVSVGTLFDSKDKAEAGADKDVVGLDTKYFAISTDWDKGSALVKSVKIDNDCDHVVVTLNENYTIEDAKDLTGTITLKVK